MYDELEPPRRRCIGTLFWSNETVSDIIQAATTKNFFGSQARGCRAWRYLGKQALDGELTLEKAIPCAKKYPNRPYPVPPEVFLVPDGLEPHWQNGKFLGSWPPEPGPENQDQRTRTRG